MMTHPMRNLRRAVVRLLLVANKIRLKIFPPAPPLPPPANAPAPTSLDGLVVTITGSSRGIGLALAKGFAEAGARIVLNGRSTDELEAARRKLAEIGAEVEAVAADVSHPEGAETLVARAHARFGQLDVLINNAAVMGPADVDVWQVEPAQWDMVLNINALAATYCSAALARLAVAAGHPARILNVSSGIVGYGFPKLGPYAVSKDAVEGLTRAYGWDSPDGLISVAAIQPRSVRTGMTRDYFGATQFALMDEPEAVIPVFLWAATAPTAVVHGRSFSEPAFAADAAAAVHVRGTLAASVPITIAPKTFVPDSSVSRQPGAYMHLLENANGFYPSAAQAFTDALQDRSLYAYPDPTYRELRQAIASETGVRPEQIALGAGSSELIDRILRLFCDAGDNIVITKPTWSFFHAFMQRWHLIPTQVPIIGSLREGNMHHDLEGILAAITPRTRLVYLVNPCNPTGTMTPPAELEAFVAQLPEHVVALIDEAYLQYAEPDQRPDLVSRLESFQARVIVLRTFSKFFGLSGLRIGYACATEETVRFLARAEMPFGISSPVCKAVPAVLADRDFRQQVYDANAEGRRQLVEGLRALNIASQPSQTNFVLFECPTDPRKIWETLNAQGLILPEVEQFLQNYALLAVGKPEHNAMVLKVLSQY